ncbi:hypothetical protein CWI37_0751p0010 [Hamiltosporidium tvaerminnensis]|uniref:Sm domain-containing protein n=1 Tax=Hamiltosporidium tvaerminnensis TaxID=1176355 RepID=A0A4Q9L2E5_9MICR|nr:hypothetical protein CWI37_0751p0010 [Hamiltosporidium tvaerminnensis]
MEKKKQKEVSEILSKLEFSIAYKIDYMKFSKSMSKIIQPLQAIYYFLTNSIKVQIYEKERPKVFYNGIIIGFDEYMNVVLDSEDGKRMLIKGDVICAIVPEKGQDSIINENEIEATEK